MKKIITILIALMIIIAGLLISKYFLTHKVKIETHKVENKGPLVEGIKVIKKDLRIELLETGRVAPFRRFKIIPQVSGKIVYISPDFYLGKIIKKDNAIFKIERIDYEVAYKKALKELKDAELNYEKILEQAKISREEIKSAKNEFKINKLSKLKLFIPQIESAKATLELAKKNVDLAKENLNRTIIKSPFTGIVVNKNCEFGEFISAGRVAGELIDISNAYVFIPIPDYEIPLIDFKNANIRVIFELKGDKYIFHGKLLRTNKIIDPKTNTINLIGEVSQPYKVVKDNIRLFFGAFVKVKISGKLFKNVAKLPSYAVHNGNEVWIYRDGKLYVKKVKIIKRVKNFVYISEGIQNKDIIITTHLPYVSNGMRVRLMKKRGRR